MGSSTYDPVKAHEYYERTKKLKGRRRSGGIPGTYDRTPRRNSSAEARARVGRLRSKISKLEGALTEARTALSKKRLAATKTEKKNSDGKTTAKERQKSKEYRDKHKNKIASKRKASSSSGGSASSSTDVNSMTVEELRARVTNIQSAIRNAKKQLSTATQQVGQLAHSALLNEVGSDQYKLHFPISRKESVKMVEDADFGGYATRHNVLCSDGRTILQDAFKQNDGMTVPLVYGHGHSDNKHVLGHCKLENREDGVYAKAYFNKTERGQDAKEQVRHGDLKFLSIFANQLHEKAKKVVSGNIREVSLVMAGANPGAYIDSVNLAHSDEDYELYDDEGIITSGMEIELMHANEDRTIQDVVDSMNDEQKNALFFLVGQAMEHDDMGEDNNEEDESENSDNSDESADSDESENEAEGDEAEGDGESDEDADSSNDEAGADVQHDNINSQEDTSMNHNVFDRNNNSGGSIAHSQVKLSEEQLAKIVKTAKRNGSLKEAIEDFIEHDGLEVGGTLTHGIENIEYLFPDAKTLESSPAFISRRMEWVDKVLGAVRKSPFSRIKTITADITPDEARARGYIKGNMKNEEFFALSKRETTPQTVYKKQKLDRDDVIDIVDLDVVAWLKAEMKVMLDEEIAGAILVGDGRSIGDEDKIKETNIRPIASDAELYVTTVNVNLSDASSSIEELVDAAIENRQYYKGSGQPTFYTSEAVISKFLTVKDNFGRRIYNSIAEVASVLRVADVVPVEVFDRNQGLVGIMVNLSDYTLGADRGGQATMFDDFDIDYNKLRYLIETRLSGALTTPKAALVFREVAGSSQLAAPAEPDFDANVVTVPTVTGVTYKNADTNATLTTGSPVTLTEGQTLNVKAVPASGYYFANSVGDEWTYEYEA